MEHDDPMERGELVPLMNKSCSRHGDNEILKEERDESQLQNKHYDRRAPAIILGFAFFESIASFGISTNLVVHLSSVLHESNASSAANVAIWIGTCYFTPLIGALIADTFLGNYKTILISLVLSLLGSTMITLSALMLPSCDGGSCHNSASGSDQNVAFFFSGLYLVAVASGGVKSAALPFGANQFDDKRSEEIGRRSSFFNFFYLCISAGILISTTLIVWLQEHVDWALGFGISTVCIAVALGGFFLGTPTYHLQTPKGTPLKNILQVLIAAFSKRRLEVPLDCTLLYEVDDRIDQNLGRQKLPHTDQFRYAFGRTEDAIHPDTMRAALSEFIATALFVFAAEGSVLSLGKLYRDTSTTGGLTVVAIADALAFSVAVAVAYNISGGHVNPAVTLGALVGGRISLVRAAFYWAAQLLGAVVAALLLRIATGGMRPVGFAVASGVGEGHALLLEIVMTFGLVYTVYATAIDPKRGHLATIAPLAIGFIVGANVLAGGPFDGAAMNPARVFGPALVGWRWKNHWVYWVGPFLGAALAGLIYEFLVVPPEEDAARTHQPLAPEDY